MSQADLPEELEDLEGRDKKFFVAMCELVKNDLTLPAFIPDISQEAGLISQEGERAASSLREKGYVMDAGKSVITLTPAGRTQAGKS